MRTREEMVIEVASAAHEDWRQQWRVTNGDKPRIKKTTDPTFLARGIAEVDIAALSYADLPSDWQAENKAAAECAVGCVLAALKQGRALDGSFVEEASATQHERWLERNAWVCDPINGNPALAKPYAELAEDEREKDRVVVRRAIAASQS